MINPNVCKRVLVVVSDDMLTGYYKGLTLTIHDRVLTKKPGRRWMYIKYSIVGDCYYLRSEA